MAFPAFLDTCVLYPAYLCDTLLRLAEAETFRSLWSVDVLCELRRNLIEQGLETGKVDYRIEEMRRSFPGRHDLRLRVPGRIDDQRPEGPARLGRGGPSQR